MRSWNARLAVVLTAGGALALVGLYLHRGIIDVALAMLIVAVLVGMHRLRRYARTELIYRRLPEQHHVGSAHRRTGASHRDRGRRQPSS